MDADHAAVESMRPHSVLRLEQRCRERRHRARLHVDIGALVD